MLFLTCTDRNINDAVLQILCNTAKYMGNISLAKNYAGRLGSLHCTRESNLEWILEGKDGIEQAQNNILSYLDMLTISIGTVRARMSLAP